MKILIVSISDLEGGAARAAYRLHHAFQSYGMISEMLVMRRHSKEKNIVAPFSKTDEFVFKIKRALAARFIKIKKSSNKGLSSLALFPSPAVEYINSSGADVVNIHWACDEFLSPEDFIKINKPVVVTMHDMWYFTGVEHYSSDNYWNVNVDLNLSGYINAWMIKRKKKNFNKCYAFVSPSRWLADSAKKSHVLNNKKIFVVPNALNFNIWKPVQKNLARKKLNIPSDKKVVLFGAIGGGADSRKGADLMMDAISGLDKKNYYIVVFGQSHPNNHREKTLIDKWLGFLKTEEDLIYAYSAADVFVMSSRMDNYPNTCLEAQACGTPVAGFNVGGVPDIVLDEFSGKLASAYNVNELMNSIEWCANNADKIKIRIQERAHDIANESIIAEHYKKIFMEACNI